jgi:hypothetical protein
VGTDLPLSKMDGTIPQPSVQKVESKKEMPARDGAGVWKPKPRVKSRFLRAQYFLAFFRILSFLTWVRRQGEFQHFLNRFDVVRGQPLQLFRR